MNFISPYRTGGFWVDSYLPKINERIPNPKPCLQIYDQLNWVDSTCDEKKSYLIKYQKIIKEEFSCGNHQYTLYIQPKMNWNKINFKQK